MTTKTHRKTVESIGREIAEISIAFKARVICDDTIHTTSYIEPHEWEFAKLFCMRNESRMEDEFTINLIQRVYERIQTKESNTMMLNIIKAWAKENNVDLKVVANSLDN